MGTYLRAARRRRRVGIERAAEDTKIRSDFLMRMESDEFDFLAPAYVRGFLRTYARYLRVDPEPLIGEFDRRFGGRVDTAQIIAQQRRSKSRRRGLREPRRVNSWVLAAVFAAGFLVLLFVIGFMQEDRRPQRNPIAVNEESPSPRPSPPPEETESPEPEQTPQEDPTLALADGIELELTVTEPCWTQIYTDGNPTPIFTGTMQPGDVERFTADKRMQVVLGFPKGVTLTVNGRELGSPGGVSPITVQLPDDVESL